MKSIDERIAEHMEEQNQIIIKKKNIRNYLKRLDEKMEFHTDAIRNLDFKRRQNKYFVYPAINKEIYTEE